MSFQQTAEEMEEAGKAEAEWINKQLTDAAWAKALSGNIPLENLEGFEVTEQEVGIADGSALTESESTEEN